jgi:hypothetical protein
MLVVIPLVCWFPRESETDSECDLVSSGEVPVVQRVSKELCRPCQSPIS